MDTSPIPPPSRQAPVVPPPPAQKHLPRPLRWALLAFAVLCLGLGVVGVFVPGLPTTVFILMAAWAAARSSPRLHEWLWYHPLFGAMLRDWADGGRVSRRSKWNATVLMALCAAILFWTSDKLWVAVMASSFMGCTLLWLWLRPEPG
ncbi:MAG: YbaN family protein [Burkholderiales bacterium]|nr:YbaN family protein [Burkholderiales bacterium]